MTAAEPLAHPLADAEKRINRALAYAEVLVDTTGFPVFPVRDDKRPATPRGFKDATTDLVALRKLWRKYPGPLIAIPTGSVSGIDVLDIDLTKHREAAAWWAENSSRLPRTWTNETRSGGLHVFFRHQVGRPCSASKIAIGVDVRGNGGYAVWWPGHLGERSILCDEPPAPWPEWLDPQPLPPLRRSQSLMFVVQYHGLTPYAEAALDSACRAILRAAPDGEQEVTLNRECFCIGTLAGAGGVPPDFAEQALQWTAHQLRDYDEWRPWDKREIDRKVRRSLKAGMRHPRGGRYGLD
jgi:Bifunctional DNA primase/polymerase, N-terminal